MVDNVLEPRETVLEASASQMYWDLTLPRKQVTRIEELMTKLRGIQEDLRWLVRKVIPSKNWVQIPVPADEARRKLSVDPKLKKWKTRSTMKTLLGSLNGLLRLDTWRYMHPAMEKFKIQELKDISEEKWPRKTRTETSTCRLGVWNSNGWDHNKQEVLTQKMKDHHLVWIIDMNENWKVKMKEEWNPSFHMLGIQQGVANPSLCVLLAQEKWETTRLDNWTISASNKGRTIKLAYYKPNPEDIQASVRTVIMDHARSQIPILADFNLASHRLQNEILLEGEDQSKVGVVNAELTWDVTKEIIYSTVGNKLSDHEWVSVNTDWEWNTTAILRINKHLTNRNFLLKLEERVKLKKDFNWTIGDLVHTLGAERSSEYELFQNLKEETIMKIIPKIFGKVNLFYFQPLDQKVIDDYAEFFNPKKAEEQKKQRFEYFTDLIQIATNCEADESAWWISTKASDAYGIQANAWVAKWKTIFPKLESRKSREALRDFMIDLIRKIGCSQVTLLVIKKAAEIKSYKDVRPIGILPAVWKLVEKRLQSRWSELIDRWVNGRTSGTRYQYGFFKGCTVFLPQLLVFSELKKNEGVAIFIDLVKAYDTVRWESLLEMLSKSNLVISEEITIYLKAQSHWSYSINGQKVVRGRGLVQGSALSPILWNLFLHLMLDGMSKEGLFAFADDIVILGKNAEVTREKFLQIKERVEQHGCEVSSSKSEVVIIKDDKIDEKEILKTLALPIVEKFRYLGANMVRAGQVWTPENIPWDFSIVSRLGKLKGLTLKIKLKTLKQMILSKYTFTLAAQALWGIETFYWKKFYQLTKTALGINFVSYADLWSWGITPQSIIVDQLNRYQDVIGTVEMKRMIELIRDSFRAIPGKLQATISCLEEKGAFLGQSDTVWHLEKWIENIRLQLRLNSSNNYRIMDSDLKFYKITYLCSSWTKFSAQSTEIQELFSEVLECIVEPSKLLAESRFKRNQGSIFMTSRAWKKEDLNTMNNLVADAWEKLSLTEQKAWKQVLSQAELIINDTKGRLDKSILIGMLRIKITEKLRKSYQLRHS